MAKNHFYWGIKKTVSMPQNAWTQLINILEGIPDILATYDANGQELTPFVAGTQGYLLGTSDFRENTLQIRHNVLIPFDAAIYEANFDDTNLSLELIRQKLVRAFNVADNLATVTLTTQTFLTRPSAIAAFRVNATIMFRATIFGRLNDTQIVTWPQSKAECLAYLAANSLEWDGANG